MPKNLSDQLLHDLGERIVHGELEPGHVLPKVETLSEMRGVSRTVVREALKGLSARRLVVSATRTGTIVQPPTEWLWWDPDIIAWASSADDPRLFLLQLSEVRLAMEPAAVRLAALNATEEDIAQMEHAYLNLEKAAEDNGSWAEADAEFHASILEGSHNQLMKSLVQTLHIGLLQSRHKTIEVLKQNPESRKASALYMHRDVLDAIRNRDPDAAYDRMRELLHSVVALIEEYGAQRHGS
ncbi:FadR/GntR family transcriptional regulator [Alkalicoccus chagannorensis]|uniref:FadR/GntR family transcriptional regulator n=1 Tax=Alkalicoccus chagannorensis TaxID=427072 RepID=UPI00040E4ACA|nr:FadR/GntR family transcriptional regulator [Alkalicoccus chagannorensis]